MGETLLFGMRDWQIVGIFDAGTTGFNSEIWGDVDQLMQTFRRPVYSSVIFRLQDPQTFPMVKSRLESDPRLTVEAKLETSYYKDQSEMMATFLRILGMSLTIIFFSRCDHWCHDHHVCRRVQSDRRDWDPAGAGVSAAQYPAGLSDGISAARFHRRQFGLFFASFMQLFTVSTMNFQTFSELAFSFTLTTDIVYKSLGFSLMMGCWEEYYRPSGRPHEIVDALRAV